MSGAGRTEVSDHPLPQDAAREIRMSILQAYTYLRLPPQGTDPKAAQQAIYNAAERIIRAGRPFGADAIEGLAIKLGCLWGQTLCDARQWEWRSVKHPIGDEVFAVVSPDRAFIVAPMRYMHRQLRQWGDEADNTTLLLFNMICDGGLPEPRPGSYEMLS